MDINEIRQADPQKTLVLIEHYNVLIMIAIIQNQSLNHIHQSLSYLIYILYYIFLKKSNKDF